MSSEELSDTYPLVSYRGFDPKWAMGQDLKIDLKSKFDPKLVAYYLHFFLYQPSEAKYISAGEIS